MAYQPKSYRKFMAASLSVAMVATAVSPALAAETKSFPDVPATDAHAANIAKAVELGLIKGNADGTFAPYASITRGQVAKILARYLQLDGKIDTTGVEPFADVPATHSDKELYEASLVVKKAGVFTGSNGKLNAADNISRQHMAKVIVNTFGLKDNGETVTISDLDKATEEMRSYIKILAQHGVTNVTAYNPTGDVKRGAFASFAVRAIEATPEVVVPAVTSVSAITNTNVSITFKALEKANEAFTVEVKDNNGNMVEVLPVSLEAGETEATLTFKTPHLVAPTGVWTVGGLKYDLDAIKNYNDIVSAASGTNQVTLLNALNKAGLKNVTADNIAAYATAINNSLTKQNLADIQKLIDDANTTNLTAAEQAVIVKAVVDSTNQVQLLSALQNKAFTRVNPDWIVAYQTAVATAPAITTASTVADVQAKINSVNTASINTANSNATSVATQNVVTDLIRNYTIDDVAPLTTKADAIKASNVKSAVFGVKEATTAASVYNALVKLSALDSTNLPAASLNANLKAEYLAAKNLATIDGTTAVSALTTAVVTAADTASSAAALTAIDAIIANTELADVKAKLQKLADVTSHKGTSKFDVSKVVDSRLVDYRAALVAVVPGGAVISQTEVETAIAGVNSTANQASNLSVLKDTTKTVVQVRDALVELAAGSANATTTAFLNTSSQVKLEVAQVIIDNRANLATGASYDAASVTAHSAGAPTYAANALQKAIVDHAATVAKFNAIGNLADAATTISTTKAALVDYAYAPYAALTTVQQLAVAEEINKLTKPVGTPAVATALNFGSTDAVSTLAQANAYIDAAIAKVK
ncbi:S-layer homology domain-containing protein [Peribacillus sp. JNUCC 23]